MRELLKRLTRMVIGYGAVQWAGPFLSLVFTPIITRALTPADYGVADYLVTIVSALASLALFALPSALTVHFNDRPEDTDWQQTVAGSALFMATVSGSICGALLFLVAPALAEHVPILTPYTNLLRLAGVTFVFGLTATVLTTTAQVALRVRWGMIFSLITILGTLVGNLLFIVVLRLGVTGMVLTPIVTNLSMWLAGVLLVHGKIGRPTSRVVEMLFRSGAILLPTMMAAWALQVSDRLFLGQAVTETELGYYAIANRMAALVGVAMGPIYLAWTPLALAVKEHPGAVDRYVNMSRYLIGAVLMAGLAIGLFANEILIVLTRPAYLPAAPYVGFLAYVYIFGGFGAVFSTGAMIGKQLASVSGSVVVGAVINVILNILLIPSYGIAGATMATIIGYGVPQVILYLVLQKRYPIPYPTGRFLAVLGIGFGLMLTGLFIPTTDFVVRLLLKNVLFAILPLSYLALKLITPYEAKQAQQFVRHRLRIAFSTVGS